MPEELALKSTKYYLSQLQTNNVRVTFHGGGEPTLEQRTIKKVTTFLQKKSNNKNLNLYIVTNGTCDKSFLKWLMENKVRISISLDGPPEIQNRNRPFKNGKKSSNIIEKKHKISS